MLKCLQKKHRSLDIFYSYSTLLFEQNVNKQIFLSADILTLILPDNI